MYIYVEISSEHLLLKDLPSKVLNAKNAQHKGPQHLRYLGFDVRIVA